uniref:Endonuclease/exonuclease/phosphatase domain-containing protein n=1 Tax=Latimeria chalumnae TaxID=7897 RepID=H3A8B0_LATCH
KSRGVAILIKKNIPFTEIKVLKGKEGRAIMLLLEIMSQKMLLVNIYAPVWGGGPTFFYRLNAKLQQFNDIPIIMGGDFNEVLDLQLDRSIKAKPHVSGTNRAIHTLISDFNLVDVWRVVNPTMRDYTFFSHRHNSYSRTDLFLISRSLIGDTFAVDIEIRTISEHAPISFTHSGILGLEKSRNWRLNVSLLRLPEVQALVKKAISDFYKCNPKGESDTGLLWDTVKAVLRGKLISYATNRKKERLQKTIELEQEIKEKELALNFHNLQYLKYEFNKLMSQKVEFALFRVRQSYFEAGEKASKLLAYHLCKLTASHNIHMIKNDSNRQMVTNRDINLTFKQFYSKLYTSESGVDISDSNTYLADIKLPCLDPGDRDVLEAPIATPEIKKAIEIIKSGKSPGPD